MNKQQLIKKIIQLTEEASEVTKEHNKLLNKYKLSELKNMRDSLIATIGFAKVQIDLIKNR